MKKHCMYRGIYFALLYMINILFLNFEYFDFFFYILKTIGLPILVNIILIITILLLM